MGVIDMVNGRLCETLPIEEIDGLWREAYNQALEDCCNVLRQCWLNGTVAKRIIEEQVAEIEKLKR